MFLTFLNIYATGSSTDIGICLERIVSKHRVMEVHMKTLTR